MFSVMGATSGNVHNPNGFEYQMKEVNGLGDLTGRAIMEFKKTFRQSYLRGEKYSAELLVAEIGGQKLTRGAFPGFNRVLLSYKLLRTVIREADASWHAAFRNVYCAYVITENTTGKQYDGSA